jgi:hypothetical protein
VALKAVGFGRLAESFLPIVAYATMFVLTMGFLGHLQIFFLHFEDLGVAVCAFGFMLSHVDFVAKNDWIRSFWGKLDVSPANLLLLRIGCPKGYKA